ncbi:MAG TPA: hypothetical protein PLP27_08975 [Crocinitomicaceae bacterium]|nr:hypothetical protein [Crocinitomicaceae bacterium]
MKFISEISPLYLILLIVLAFALAFWLYNGKEGKQFSSKLRWTLIGIRSLGLILIGILFLGIFLQTTKTKSEKPILINLIDNSLSMNNYADSNVYKKQINEYLTELNTKFGAQYVIKNYSVGAHFQNLDSLTFNEDKTNLSAGFSSIIEQFYGNNIGAITLISDGNFNEGDHPLYTAVNLPYVPVFSLAVGDTNTKKDIIVRNVQSNDFVFLNNSFPVEALIEVTKMGAKTLQVRLVNQGKTISSQTITTSSNTAFYKVNFEVEAKAKGVQYYQVIVDAVKDEYTTKNNKQGFYIEVVDDMRKILMLATAPHPDIAAIKAVLEKEKNNKIDIKTTTDWGKKTDQYDLVIFHNPLEGNSAELLSKIIADKKPVLAILGTQSNFRRDLSSLGFNLSASNQTDENVPIFNKNFDLFELSAETVRQLRTFPPLKSVFGKMKLSPNAKVLFYQGVGEVQKEDGQLFFNTLNDVKIGVIQGEGLWRWKFANFRNNENTNAFDEIFQKTAQYLTVKKNNSPFKVTVPKKSNTTEPVIIKAEVYNAAMELTTKANVDFKLIDSKGKQQIFDFSVVSNYYSLNLGKLPAGNYKWIASTKIENKPYQLSGELVIEANEIELIDNTAKFDVLEQLSTQTHGQFYRLANYKKLIDNLSTRDDIRPVETQEQTVKNLIDFWWLILLIVFTFGSEWFIKRYQGSY